MTTKKKKTGAPKKNSNTIKHGGWRYLGRGYAQANENCPHYPECGCKERCKAVDAMAEQLETEIMSLPHIDSSDLFLVRHFIKLLVFQEVVDRWLLKKGIVIEKNDQIQMQGVFNHYLALENSVQRLADRLGLSPFGRKQLRDKARGKGNLQDLAVLVSEIESKEGRENEH